MNRNHRILPRRKEARLASSLHHPQFLGLILFFCLFAIFSILILSSKLHPIGIQGHAEAGSRANISNSTAYLCNLSIAVGTNLVSLPCLPLSTTLLDFFSSFSDNGSGIESIYVYNPLLQQRWEVYNDSLPSYVVPSLTTVDHRDGIYLTMSAPEQFTLLGYIPSVSTFRLYPGWNLQGYPSKTTRDLTTSLATIINTYARIKTLNGTEESGNYLYDDAPPGGETLNQTEMYHGYWFYMNYTDDWQVIQ